MNKAYNRVNGEEGWQDFPSMDTPLDKYNLDKVDVGLNEIDNRVIMLDETKASKIEVSTLFKEVSYEESTGIITFTRKNGAIVTIDTPMEKIQTGIYYNPDTEKLVLPLIDGTTMEVDLSRLMKFDEFIDSDTIAFSVKSNGTVTAIVKDGSIQEKHLQPSYLADIKVEVAKAEASATAAATSEVNSRASENATKASENAAKKSEENTASYATSASESATTAIQKAAEAAESEANAAFSKESAVESAEIATDKANIATEKANISTQGADTATEKAAEASNYATEAESFTRGGTGTRENEDVDNAKYYYEQLQNASQGLNGLIPKGTITFEELADEENQQPGYFFNVSDSFVSDERFKDGSGIFYGAGNNVIYTADGMWDVTAASMVSGVKGDKETEYRQGFVNLTAENIGALPENGNAVSATRATQDEIGNNIVGTYQTKTGDTANNIVSFTQASSRTNIETDEEHFTMFGKIKKWFADTKNGAFHTVANNLTTTSKNYVLDARQGKILNDKFGGMSFGVDADGNYGYIKAGADTVTPFKDTETIMSDVGFNCRTVINSAYNSKGTLLTQVGYNAPDDGVLKIICNNTHYRFANQNVSSGNKQWHTISINGSTVLNTQNGDAVVNTILTFDVAKNDTVTYQYYVQWTSGDSLYSYTTASLATLFFKK